MGKEDKEALGMRTPQWKPLNQSTEVDMPGTTSERGFPKEEGRDDEVRVRRRNDPPGLWGSEIGPEGNRSRH